MYKHIVPTLIAISAALFASAAQADQLADIKSRGTLICGTLGIAEPFSYPNPQTREIQGYDVDFCSALARSLNVRLELKLVAVPARIPELQQARIDVLIANLGWTAERAEQIAYSDQYYASSQKVATRRGEGYKTPADLAGKRISAPKGTTSEMAARKVIPRSETVTFQDPSAAFLALQQGKVEGFVVTEMVLVKLKQQVEGTAPVDILEPPLVFESWGIGMRKGETGLINSVNSALQQMEKSGEATKIFDKWFGPGTTYKMKRDFKVEPIKG